MSLDGIRVVVRAATLRWWVLSTAAAVVGGALSLAVGAALHSHVHYHSGPVCEVEEPSPLCVSKLGFPSYLSKVPSASLVTDHLVHSQLTAKRLAADLGVREDLVAANLLAPPVDFTPLTLPEPPVHRLNIESSAHLSPIRWRTWDPARLRQTETGGAVSEVAALLLERDPLYEALWREVHEEELRIREELMRPQWPTPVPVDRNLGTLAQLLMGVGLLAGILALYGVWKISRLQPMIVRVARHQIRIGTRTVAVEDCSSELPDVDADGFAVTLKQGGCLQVPERYLLSHPDRVALVNALRVALRTERSDAPEACQAMQALRRRSVSELGQG